MEKKFIEAISILTELLLENDKKHQLEINKFKEKIYQIEILIENASNRK